jgi:hypothetical protein
VSRSVSSRAVAELAELIAASARHDVELAALRAEVGALKVAAHLRGSDHDWLAVVAAAVGGYVFSVRALVARADVEPSLRVALAGLSGRVIGARLRRLARRPPPGFALVLVGRDADGCMWQLSHVDPCDRALAAV